MTTTTKQLQLKKYWAFSADDPPIYYRSGTSDEYIIQSILLRQEEYKFPAAPDLSLIYDMGANIGIVSIIMTRLYPSATIHAFEPQEENFEILKRNIEGYPKIVPHKYALGATTGIKKLFPSDDPKNRGGFSTIIECGEPVQIGAQSIKSVVERYGVPQLIKIDVEGAECEILRNFPNIDQVKWITGELHSEDAEYLMLHILSTHFRLQLARGFFDKMWHFQALNKTWTDFGRDASSENEKNGLVEKLNV